MTPPRRDAVTPSEDLSREQREALQPHARPTKPDSGDETCEHEPREHEPAGTADFVPAPDHTADYAPGPPPVVKSVKRGRDVPVPQSVAGYEIVGVLGRGAMGVVYKARQRGLKRLVALKMILSGEHASAQDLGRFQAEANAVAQLQHPGIVQIFEVGEDEGRPFFSLEFVDGTSLHKKIQGTPLPPREAAELLQEMAEAMHYAHEHGIIHRDLKPANVLMTAAGKPKIGDFGLAKQLNDDESGLTGTGAVLGTPSYMSPEQAEGRLADTGPLADVYSLGAILYDMLTGRPPFRGTSMLDTLEQLRTREPVPPMQFQPGVPRDLETICLKCLQKDRTKRYASAGDLAADVGRFLRGEPIVARPVSVAERTLRWCRRNKAWTAVIAAGILALVGYAVTVTAFAGWLGVANAAEAKARDDAEKNAEEATKQKNLADEKRQLAEKREEDQRQTATVSLLGTAKIADISFNVLQNRRLSIGASPETKKLRNNALEGMRKQLENIGRMLQQTATVSNADVFNAQLVGDRLKKLGRSQEARKMYEVGRKAAVVHVENDPTSDKARANLGIMEMCLGDVALELEGDARTALKHYLESRRLHEAIQKQGHSKDYPPLDMKRIIATDNIHIGQALLALGRAKEAQTYFEEALRYRQEWLAPEPNDPERRSYNSEARAWLSIAAWRRGDGAAALEHSEAALAIGMSLLEQFPKNAGFNAEAAETQGTHGDALLRLGRTADAQRHYQQALAKLTVALVKNPDQIEHQPLLALTHERLGLAASVLKQDAVARDEFKQARQVREELWDLDHDNLARKAALVLAMARNGERALAMKFATKIRPDMANSTELTLQIARSFAVLAAHDKPGERKNTQDALAALTAATAQDYRDAAVLASDPDLAALRQEPAFKELLDRIRAR